MAVNFFEMFNRPIVSGRGFTRDDLESGRNDAIVDRTFVQQVLGGRDPIGMRVRQPRDARREEPGPWYVIVGVVGDLATAQNAMAEDAVLYRPVPPRRVDPINIAVHVRGAIRSRSRRGSAA